MNNNPKRHFHIDSDASTDQALKLLDAVQSDNEDEINELMNDFDTKLIAPEEIELTDNPENVRLEFDIEANVHVVEKGTTHTRELEKNKRKKSQKKVLQSHGNTRLSTKVIQLSIFMNKLLILMFWLRYLLNKSDLYLQQNGRKFLTNV